MARSRGGAWLALLGICLVALNLRTSVASLAPLLGRIGDEIPLDVVTVSLLGVLPPALFALFGLAGGRLARSVGVERSLLLALVAIIAGHVLRAAANSTALLVAGTLLTLTGMGAGNVLLPPAVKIHFPHRTGTVTSLYATLIAVSTALPPLVAVPAADAVGWRGALGSWALLAIVAALPWFGMLRSRVASVGRAGRVRAATGRAAWRGPTGWALAVVFSVSAVNGYSMFAWLPTILTETAGLDDAHAGALLALYAGLGIPLAVVIPPLTSRPGSAVPLLLAGMVFTIAGNLGLLLTPAANPALWVTLAGLGPLLFPACLALFQTRTRTADGATRLSAFAQSVGFTLAIAGPLVVGILYETTGGWTWPLLVLAGVALPGSFAAFAAGRAGYWEDESRASGRDRRPYTGPTS